MTLIEMWETVSRKVSLRPAAQSSADDRENEYDTGAPGEPRPMTGFLYTLTEKQRAAAAAYRGPERHVAKRPLKAP